MNGNLEGEGSAKFNYGNSYQVKTLIGQFMSCDIPLVA